MNDGNASGKTEAFLKAYDAYADALFRHCYFRVYDRERARDLMQETFARTWECIVDGKDIENLRAFLYRVANNLVIDFVRKKKESSLDDMMEQGFEPSAPTDKRIVNSAEAANIISALDKVDEKHRDVIVMRYVDGLSPKEIAGILDESENAVSVRLHRAIKDVRRHIDPDGIASAS
jgi:RNA polymerase sigma-70 factor (ECF subfamily)